MLTKKAMLVVGALCLSSVVAANLYAADPGAYVGGQLGWGKTSQSFLTRSDFNYSFSSDKDTGLAGRVFAGYQFDPTWAVELGWTKLSAIDVKGSSHYVFSTPYSIHARNWNGSIVDHGTVKTDALDLVGKATVPVTDKVSVYGKAGAAFVMGRFHDTISGLHSGKVDSKENKLFPTVGVGASYALTSNLSVDAGYDRIQKIGNTNIGSTNLLSAGITYHFE